MSDWVRIAAWAAVGVVLFLVGASIRAEAGSFALDSVLFAFAGLACLGRAFDRWSDWSLARGQAAEQEEAEAAARRDTWEEEVRRRG